MQVPDAYGLSHSISSFHATKPPVPSAQTEQNIETTETPNNPLKVVHKFISENKTEINTTANVFGALTNLFAFLEGNFHLFNMDTDKLETISTFFAKCATSARGITGAIDCFNKNNLIPLLGFAGEVPVAIFASGFNLWLARGIPQGINQFQGILKRRGITTEVNGKTITLSREDGDDFKKYGISMFEGLKLSFIEFGKIIKELFTKPFKGEQRMPHSVFVCSIFQILGPILHLSGLKTFGAWMRDTFGAAVDVGYILDKKKADEPSYGPAGAAWIGSAMVDYLKRLDYFESRVSNSTQLSLFFDGIAGAFYGIANFGKSAKKTAAQSTVQPEAA